MLGKSIKPTSIQRKKRMYKHTSISISSHNQLPNPQPRPKTISNKLLPDTCFLTNLLQQIPHKPPVIRLITPIPKPNPATHMLKQRRRCLPVPLEMDTHSIRYPPNPALMLFDTRQVTSQDQSMQSLGKRSLIPPGPPKSEFGPRRTSIGISAVWRRGNFLRMP